MASFDVPTQENQAVRAKNIILSSAPYKKRPVIIFITDLFCLSEYFIFFQPGSCQNIAQHLQAVRIL